MLTWLQRWCVYRQRASFYLALLLLAWLAPRHIAVAAQDHLFAVAAFIALGWLGVNPILFWFVSVRLPEESRSRMTRCVVVGAGVLVLCALSWRGQRSLTFACRGLLGLAESWLWASEACRRQRLDPRRRGERR